MGKFGLTSSLKGLLARSFVVLLSVMAVSCGDYSQKTVAIPDTSVSSASVSTDSIKKDDLQVLSRIPGHFDSEIKYPQGHTTRIAINYGSYNDRLNELRDRVYRVFDENPNTNPYVDIPSDAAAKQAAIDEEAQKIPAGGTMKVTFYDEDKEKLDVSNFEFSLFTDGERIIDTHIFSVSGDPAEFNSTVFENSVELNLPQDVSNDGVISLEIYDDNSQTTTIFEMTSKVQN